MTGNEVVEVDMTWKDTGGKLMKGYKPGKGLGARLQGIIEPIQPQLKMDTFG